MHGYSAFLSFVKTVIMTGEISDTLNPYPERNNSQRLQFMGPQVVCDTRHTRLVFDRDNYTGRLSEEIIDFDYDRFRYWGVKELWLGLQQEFTPNGTFSIEQNEAMGVADCDSTDVPSCNYLAIENTSSTCKEHHVMYTVHVNWTNGVRKLAIEKEQIDPQPYPVDAIQLWRDNTTTISAYQPYSNNVRTGLPGYEGWSHHISEAMPYWTSFEILQALLLVIRSAKSVACAAANALPYGWPAANGTVLQLRPVDCSPEVKIDDQPYCRC